MATSTTKPKTIEEWETERKKKAKQENGFIRIPYTMWYSEAFQALTKSEKLVLLECLAQVRYAPKGKKKRDNVPKERLFRCGLWDLLNNGEFGLPSKYLQERGIKGEETISRAKKRLVEVGFLDVVQQGSFARAGRFRFSDRWRSYNSAALLTEDNTPCYEGPLPGYCHYPYIIEHNNSRPRNNNVLNLREDNIDGYIQLDLFEDYAQRAIES